MTFLRILSLSVAALAISNAYATDCQNISGQWTGEMTVKHTMWTCSWHMNAIITNEGSSGRVLMQYKLTNTNHKHLCGSTALGSMSGQCVTVNGSNQLGFQNMIMSGTMINNQINLSAEKNAYNPYPTHIALNKSGY